MTRPYAFSRIFREPVHDMPPADPGRFSSRKSRSSRFSLPSLNSYILKEKHGSLWMNETDWVGRLEDARKEIEEAATDREAIVIVFTELSRLLLDLKTDAERR
jgi:hypothetical protein